MNTLKQAMEVSIEISRILETSKGVLEITLYSGESVKVNVLNHSTSWDKDGFYSYLKTFTTNIAVTTTYDIYYIKEVK